MSVFSYKELAQLERGSPNLASRLRNSSSYRLKLVDVLYGHKGSGKAYTYLASENVRAGDYVTPEVTHAKGSHPTYRTLGKVVRTYDSDGEPGQRVTGHLASGGIMLKTIGPTDQRSLPGFKARKAQDPNFTTKQWEEEGIARYEAKVSRILGRKTTTDKTKQTSRILENRK